MKKINIIKDGTIIKCIIFLYNTVDNINLHDLILDKNGIKKIEEYYPDVIEKLEISDLIGNKKIETIIVTNIDACNIPLIDLRNVIYKYTDIPLIEQCLFNENNEFISIKTDIPYKLDDDFFTTKIKPDFKVESLDFCINEDDILNVYSYKNIFHVNEFEKDLSYEENGQLKLSFPYIYYMYNDYYGNNLNMDNVYLFMEKGMIDMSFDSVYEYMSKKILPEKTYLYITECELALTNSYSNELDLFTIFNETPFSEKLLKMLYFSSTIKLEKFDNRFKKKTLTKQLNYNKRKESLHLYLSFELFDTILILYTNNTGIIYYDLSKNNDIQMEEFDKINNIVSKYLNDTIAPILKINKNIFKYKFENNNITYNIKLSIDSKDIINEDAEDEDNEVEKYEPIQKLNIDEFTNSENYIKINNTISGMIKADDSFKEEMYQTYKSIYSKSKNLLSTPYESFSKDFDPILNEGTDYKLFKYTSGNQKTKEDIIYNRENKSMKTKYNPYASRRVYEEEKDEQELAIIETYTTMKELKDASLNTQMITKSVEKLSLYEKVILKNKYIIAGISNNNFKKGITFDMVIDDHNLVEYFNKFYDYSTIKFEVSSFVDFTISGIKNKRELDYSISLIYSILGNIDDEIYEVSDSKSNAKKLTLFDPLTFGKSNNALIGYSRRCQKKMQPVIATSGLMATLSDKDKQERVFDYVNRKTNTKVQYYCPNKEYPFLGFSKGDDLCIPCCAKKKVNKDIYKSCMETGKFHEKVVKNNNYKYQKIINLNKDLVNYKTYTHPLLSSIYKLAFVYIEGESILNTISYILKKPRDEILANYNIVNEISDINDKEYDFILKDISNEIKKSIIIIYVDNLDDLSFNITIENQFTYSQYIVIYSLKKYNFVILDDNDSMYLDETHDLITKITKNIKPENVFDLYYNKLMLFAMDNKYTLIEQVIFEGFTIAIGIVYRSSPAEVKYIFIKNSPIDHNIKKTKYLNDLTLMSYEEIHDYFKDFNLTFKVKNEIILYKYNENINAISYCNVVCPIVPIKASNLNTTIKTVLNTEIDYISLYENVFRKNKYKIDLPKNIISTKNHSTMLVNLYKIVLYSLIVNIKTEIKTKDDLITALDSIVVFVKRPDYKDSSLEISIKKCTLDDVSCYDTKIPVDINIKHEFIETLYHDITVNNSLNYMKNHISSSIRINNNIYNLLKTETINQL